MEEASSCGQQESDIEKGSADQHIQMSWRREVVELNSVTGSRATEKTLVFTDCVTSDVMEIHERHETQMQNLI